MSCPRIVVFAALLVLSLHANGARAQAPEERGPLTTASWDAGSISLDGTSIRVPTPNVSVIDFKFVPSRATTKEEVNAVLKAAADGPLKGILAYTNAPNVSIDFNHDPHSSTFASDQTKVLDGKLVRVMSWYDNEWGFSNRMSDTAVAMAKLI